MYCPWAIFIIGYILWSTVTQAVDAPNLRKALSVRTSFYFLFEIIITLWWIERHVWGCTIASHPRGVFASACVGFPVSTEEHCSGLNRRHYTLELNMKVIEETKNSSKINVSKILWFSCTLSQIREWCAQESSCRGKFREVCFAINVVEFWKWLKHRMRAWIERHPRVSSKL